MGARSGVAVAQWRAQKRGSRHGEKKGSANVTLPDGLDVQERGDYVKAGAGAPLRRRLA